jgi:membrane-associated phospholipid phosphatase
VVAAAGLLLLVACGLVARNGRVGAVERHVFRAINDLPAWLYRPLWVFQQFGNLFVALAIGVVVALLLRRWWVAAAVVGAVGLKLVGERTVKQVVERSRPGTTIGNIHARGNVPLHGLSFVSGHSVIVTAVATLLTPVLRGHWKLVPWVFVVLNGVARIYVGAHNPLDVIGGAGLGLFIGGILNVFVAPVDERSGPTGDIHGRGRERGAVSVGADALPIRQRPA